MTEEGFCSYNCRSRGKGTTVTFALRVVSVLQAPSAPACLPRPAATVSGRILVAEDEAVNRLTTLKFLEQLGYEAEGVCDGEAIFPALQRSRFDAILMDIQMPQLDGLEATRRIRSASAPEIDASIPIVALTAFAMRGDRERFLEAGFDAYITKPFEQEELAEVLSKILQDRRR